MFSQPAPATPILATTTSPASATSPTRPSRLRGLSYLRNYTHTHLHSRENSSESSSSSSRRQTLTRSTSYPTTTPSSTGDRSTTPTRIPSNQRDGPNGEPDSTSSWLSTASGQSGASRTGTQSQSTPRGVSSAQISTSNNLNNPVPSTAMGRTRSATTSRVTGADISYTNAAPLPAPSSYVTNGNGVENGQHQLPSIRFSQHQDVRAPRPSLVFSPMSRILPSGKETIRVGRYSERENGPTTATAPNIPSSAPIGFKSKVVSRRHCEFWYQDSVWYIKDVKSSSGTFLNHVRLSPAATESKPFPIKDGDIVQLGIDFKGGEEMIFRCVKIRVELNRGWQNALNSFNVASHKRLRNMQKQNASSPAGSSSSQDCTICLNPVAPCQSLFVAPCSHTWHYKCVRRIINGPSWPQFICPNCRAVADLEADIDDPFPEQDWEEVDMDALDDQENQSIMNGDRTPAVQTFAQREQAPEPNVTEPFTPTNCHHSRESTDETTADSSDGAGNGLSEAVDYLDISRVEMPAGSGRPESHSTVQPVDIRAGRAPSNGNVAMNVDSFIRNERTPSPSSRLNPDVPHALNGSDGPMTPRNDAGPFVFDGSGGRSAEAAGVVMNPFNAPSPERAAN